MPTPYAVSSDLVSAWPAKSLAVATYLDSALAAKTDTAMTQNAQTGTSYSYVLLDAAKLLTMNNAASNTVTVTKQATVAWVTGTQLRIMNLGAGVTTLVADTGVTINGNVALKQYQGGTLIRTASDVWLFVPTASGSGMDLITPTSVAGTGVTLSGGVVSISAASTVSVNGCFTAAYSNYYLVFSAMLGSAASCAFNFRMRASGADDTSSNYVYAQSYGLFTGTGGYAGSAGTTSWSNWGNFANGAKRGVLMTLTSPQLAEATAFFMQGIRSDASDTQGGLHNVSSAFDGLTFATTNATTVSGTLRIYGLRNS